jgi:hypothetical protein
MLSLEELRRRAVALQAQDEAGWARWRRRAHGTAPGGAGPRAAPAGDLERLYAEGRRLLAAGVRLAEAAARGRVDPAAHARLRAALRAHRAALRRRRGVPPRPPGPPDAAGAAAPRLRDLPPRPAGRRAVNHRRPPERC